MKRLLLALIPVCLAVAQIIWFPQPTPKPAAVAQLGNINGAFFEFEGMTPENLPPYLDEMKSLGMDTLVTTALREYDCAHSSWDWHLPTMQQLLPLLLDEAQARGIKVYLGTTNNEHDCPANDAQATEWLVDLVTSRMDSAALAGWYLGEPYIQDSRWFDGQVAQYKALVDAVHHYSLLPTLAAPYLVSWPADPAAAAFSAGSFLDGTGLNVLIYQDCMGSRFASTTCNLGWNGATGIKEFFAAISAVVGPGSLWVDHELFNARFGVDDGKGSASITRLNQQIAAVPDSLISKRLTWTSQDWMSDVSPVRLPEAGRLLAGYRATHGGLGLLKPLAVYWQVSPDFQHPDVPLSSPIGAGACSGWASAKLTDGRVGDALDVDGTEWVGAMEDNALCVDLGRARHVDWVDLHAGKSESRGVKIPHALIIRGSADGWNWSALSQGSYRTRPGYDGEWAIGNTAPLNANVRYLWLSLVNDGKTRVSELEIVGR